MPLKNSSLIDLALLPAAELMKGHRFVRRRNVWNRSRMGLVDVVSVQSSGANESGRHEEFTFNVGVCLPDVDRIIWGDLRPGPAGGASDSHCAFSIRVGRLIAGDLIGRTRDVWWRVNRPEDVGSVGAEVSRSLDRHVIPFLDDLTSVEAIERTMDGLGGPQASSPSHLLSLAVLKAHLHRRDEAADLLRRMTSGPWEERARHAAAELKIVL